MTPEFLANPDNFIGSMFKALLVLEHVIKNANGRDVSDARTEVKEIFTTLIGRTNSFIKKFREQLKEDRKKFEAASTPEEIRKCEDKVTDTLVIISLHVEARYKVTMYFEEANTW